MLVIDMCMQCSYRLGGHEGGGLKVATVSQQTKQEDDTGRTLAKTV